MLFRSGRFPQEPTLRALMEYLQNSYVIAGTELQVMEVQLGKEINVHDKKVYALER